MNSQEILNSIYKAYGTDSGILFGITNKDVVKYIIEFTINRITPESPSGSEAWVSVEDRLPTIADSCAELYYEVATLQLGSNRPNMMKYWEVKDSPFVKYWISLPQPPIK